MVCSRAEASVRVRAKHLEEPRHGGGGQGQSVVGFLPGRPTDEGSGAHRIPRADLGPGRLEHQPHFYSDHSGTNAGSMSWGFPPNCNHLGPSILLGLFPLSGVGSLCETGTLLSPWAKGPGFPNDFCVVPQTQQGRALPHAGWWSSRCFGCSQSGSRASWEPELCADVGWVSEKEADRPHLWFAGT